MWDPLRPKNNTRLVFLNILRVFPAFFFALEAEDSNEAPSSEEDQDLVDFNPDLNIKQSRRTISQIIKDKKKQTQLTLQWWVQTHQ